MANIDAMFPSKYLKAADLDGKEWPLVIRSVIVENVGRDDDPEDKPVLHFSNAKKGMVLNKTNAASIAGLFGKDTDRWTGQTITLYSTQVLFGNQMVDSIRVRAYQTQASPPPQPPPQPTIPATGPSAIGTALDDDIPFAPCM